MRQDARIAVQAVRQIRQQVKAERGRNQQLHLWQLLSTEQISKMNIRMR